MAVWSKWTLELKKRVFGNPAQSSKDSGSRKEPQDRDIPQDNSAPAAPPPAVPVRRELTEENLEKWRILLQFVIKDFIRIIRQHVPESGKKDRCGIGLKLDGTENRAFLVVERSAGDPSLKVLSVQVVRAGHDRCAMNYIKKGTQEELLDYLADEASLSELLDSIRHLSDRVDEMY